MPRQTKPGRAEADQFMGTIATRLRRVGTYSAAMAVDLPKYKPTRSFQAKFFGARRVRRDLALCSAVGDP